MAVLKSMYFQRKYLTFAFPRMRFSFVESCNKYSIMPALPSRHVSEGNEIMEQSRLLVNAYSTRSKEANEINVDKMKINQLLPQLKDLPNITEQMKVTMHWLQLSPQALQTRYLVFNKFNALFGSIFEYHELNIFGSCINHLGFFDSDMDMLLTLFPEGSAPLNTIRNPSPQKFSSRTPLMQIVLNDQRKITLRDLKQVPIDSILNLVAWLLRDGQLNCENVAICSRIFPLIRFQARQAGFSCDLTIRSKMAVHNTQLIKLYVEMEDRFHLLMFTIRLWFKHLGVIASLSHKLTSYGLTLMVIFFLQQQNPPVLPTLTDLQALNGTSIIIEGWEYGFCQDLKKIPKSKNTKSPAELLKDFIIYFANFDFDKSVISPRSLQILSTEELLKQHPSFKLCRINIQDPFELSRNVALNMDIRTATTIVETFQRTAATILKTSHQLAGKPWDLTFLLN